MPVFDQHSSKPLQYLEVATFLRKFEQRNTGLMWLLGAGASSASGIKTAGDMIWDFKARLYRSAKSVSASALADLGDDRTRRILQDYFDKDGSYPEADAQAEYAAYFERTYPDAQDRQRYIATLMRGAKPSYGHHALAHLLKRDLTRVVWTTNFDRVFEDAVHTVFGTGSVMTVGDLGEPSKVSKAYADQRWPLYAKLHGDFHSSALKNTDDELAEQDVSMRRILLDTCRNRGLIVAGYSGRDASIMDVLREALNDGSGFPNGLFWIVREQDIPYQTVQRLVADAKAAGIDADFVKCGGFDELLSDLIRYLPETEQLSIQLDEKRKIKPRTIDLSDRKPSAPFVRTNALPIMEYPKTLRLIECEIDGTKAVQKVVKDAGSNLLAHRIKKGVVAFGDDAELKRVFASNNIKNLDTHGVLADRLQFESGERGLLRDALFRAISERCGLKLNKRDASTFVRADSGDFLFDNSKLTSAVNRLHGELPGGITWSEACDLKLDYKLDQLWLMLDPYVIFDTSDETSPDAVQSAKDFVRERRVTRYNSQVNSVLDGWISVLLGPGSDPIQLGIDGGTGIGALFEILPVTGFSGLQS